MRSEEVTVVDDAIEVEAVEFVEEHRLDLFGLLVGPVGPMFRERLVEVVELMIAVEAADGNRAHREPAEVALLFEVLAILGFEVEVRRPVADAVATARASVGDFVGHRSASQLHQHQQECSGGVVE